MHYQKHFFCGIGGWPLALQLAGWDYPCWSASLPCQPFSLSGKNKGFADPRAQLWNPFLELLKVGQPLVVFGEQVEAVIGKGWVDRVQSDLEAAGYTFGFVVLPAAGVGAPHRRYRIFWVAYADHCDWRNRLRSERAWLRWEGSSGGGIVGHAGSVRCNPAVSGDERSEEETRSAHRPVVDRSGDAGIVADSQQPGLEGHTWHGDDRGEPGRQQSEAGGPAAEGGGWSDYEIIQFKDGSFRRIESGVAPMVAGLPKGVVHCSNQSLPIDPQATQEARKLRLHGYGNSIVAPLGAEFVMAFMELMDLK